MKIRLAFGIVTLAIAALLPQASAQMPICGDCNQDGVLSILDALQAAQHGTGLITIVTPAFELCDVEADFGDGDVDVLDSLRIAQVAVGLVAIPLCTQATNDLTIVSVTTPVCVRGGETGIAVIVDVFNSNPDAANITSVALVFTDPSIVDVSSDYSVVASPANPTLIGGMASAVFSFTVSVGATPAAGPITINADITGTDTFTGVAVDSSTSLSPGIWVIALLYTDFEGSIAGWVNAGDWELGNPGTLLPPKPGPNMFGTIIAGRYREQGSVGNPTGRSLLRTPPLTLAVGGTAVMEFTMYRDFEGPDRDGGNIKGSTDGGISFSAPLLPISPSHDGTIAGGFNNPLVGQSAWLGSRPGYENVMVDLSPFAGSTVHLYFDFGANSAITTDLGWYIDDVIVCDVSGIPPGRATNPIPANGSTNVIAFPTGVDLRWTPGALATDHDVYFDTSNPPLSLLAVGLVGSTVPSSGLQPLTTYYWRVDSRNSTAVTTGTVWSFTTNFLVGLPEILINEVNTGTPDYVEIYNGETVPIDISGWRLTTYNNAVGTIDGTFIFPAGTMLQPSAFTAVVDAGAVPPGGFLAGFNINMTNTSSCEALLQFSSGEGIDFVGINYTTFNILPMDLTFTAPVALNISAGGIAARRNFIDTDNVSDWQNTGTATLMTENPGQPLVSPPSQAHTPQPGDTAVGVLARPAGHRLAWLAGPGTTTGFEVFFDTSNPPVASLGMTGGATTLISPPLSPLTTYYWRVDSINSVATTTGMVWIFTTSNVTNSPVIINEMCTGAPDFVELYNNGAAPIDIGGWQIHFITDGNLDGVYTFAAATMINAGAFRVVADGAVAGSLPTGFNINWFQFDGTPECLLIDNMGVVRDYNFSVAIAGGPAPVSQPAQTVLVRDMVPRQTPMAISVRRRLRPDNDLSSDWNVGGTSPGALNPGQ